MTQFELLTAAALAEFARRGVEVAVVEAGLGGRWDATNVLARAGGRADQRRARAHALARSDRHRHRAREARRRAGRARRSWSASSTPRPRRRSRAAPAARVVRAVETGADRAAARLPAHELRRRPRRRRGAPRRRSTRPAWPRPPRAWRSRGACRSSPSDPLTLYDGAHNPSGIAALAAALPDVLGGRRPVVVVSVLDDKDAAAMLRELLPHAAGAVFTRSAQPARAARPRRSSRSPASSAARGEIEPDPRARGRARPRARRARRRGRRDRLDLPRRRPAGRAGGAGGGPRCERRRPGLLPADADRRGRASRSSCWCSSRSATPSVGCSCRPLRLLFLDRLCRTSPSSASTTTR